VPIDEARIQALLGTLAEMEEYAARYACLFDIDERERRKYLEAAAALALGRRTGQ
jgi:hypothetical protein